MTNEEKLGSAPLFRLMMSMGIPTLVAQIINLLYNIIDRIYIGHIPEVGATALTGVWLALPMIVIISAFSAFVGAGPALCHCAGKRKERGSGTDPGKWIFPSSRFFCFSNDFIFYHKKTGFVPDRSQ